MLRSFHAATLTIRSFVFLFIFSGTVALAHETQTSLPQPNTMGFRVAGTSSWATRWSANSPDFSAPNSYYPQTDFYLPAAATTWMGQSGASTGQWTALQTSNNAANANVIVYGRRCATGQTWTPGTSNSGNGNCVTFNSNPCDADHTLETRGTGQSLTYFCIDPPERQCPGASEWDHATNACGSPSCPPGQTWDALAGECSCGTGNVTNPFTMECVSCPSERFWTGPSANGYIQGQCMPSAQDCVDSGGTIVNDEAQTSVTYTGGGTATANSQIVGCLPPPPNGCTNVTGKVTTATSQQFDYCQERKQQCDTEGGTYGSVGAGDEYAHVCLKNAGSAVPTCASGSALHYKEYGPDSYGFACTPTTPPNNKCDAQKYDCDDDGHIDDQDNNGCVDNGTLNDFTNCVASNGTGTDPGGTAGTGADGGFDGPNTGDDPLDPPVDGAGDCDPTSQNYVDCINKGSAIENLNNVLTGEGTPLFNDYAATDSVETIAESSYAGVMDAPIVAALDGFSANFAGSGECPSPSFSFFGSEYTIDFHCTLYDSISGILQLVMLAVWVIAGARHLMSA